MKINNKESSVFLLALINNYLYLSHINTLDLVTMILTTL